MQQKPASLVIQTSRGLTVCPIIQPTIELSREVTAGVFTESQHACRGTFRKLCPARQATLQFPPSIPFDNILYRITCICRLVAGRAPPRAENRNPVCAYTRMRKRPRQSASPEPPSLKLAAHCAGPDSGSPIDPARPPSERHPAGASAAPLPTSAPCPTGVQVLASRARAAVAAIARAQASGDWAALAREQQQQQQQKEQQHHHHHHQHQDPQQRLGVLGALQSSVPVVPTPAARLHLTAGGASAAMAPRSSDAAAAATPKPAATSKAGVGSAAAAAGGGDVSPAAAGASEGGRGEGSCLSALLLQR